MIYDDLYLLRTLSDGFCYVTLNSESPIIRSNNYVMKNIKIIKIIILIEH